MNAIDLKKIISQIRKYHMEKVFDTPNDFDKWVRSLTKKQINNFNSLTIEPSEIKFPLVYLINKNLLNCDDYPMRIEAMSKLKNADGWYHLFDKLCVPNFLNSKNYYQDMEMISRARSAQHPLWIIGEDTFINSPYHNEDLKLIVEAKDTPKENGEELDWLVEEALTVVAGNADSINSPYHQQDMQLIAIVGSEYLQMSNSFPEESLNNLATNKVSLKDKFHLENMILLTRNSKVNELLYRLMTDREIIKGEYYREEIKALVGAKSKIKAYAIYCYIVNPDDFDEILLMDAGLDFFDISKINRKNSIKGSNTPNYLEHLELLNQIDNEYVFYVETLIANKKFANSPFCERDLNILLSTIDKDTFLDLYRFMNNDITINSKSHEKDLDIISKTIDPQTRRMLIECATNEDNLKSCYHDFDMKHISKLDIKSIDRKTSQSISHYLLVPNGINHPEHVERLEKLLRGEYIDTNDAILNHLDYLESNPNGLVDTSFESVTLPKEKTKIVSRFTQIFKKIK